MKHVALAALMMIAVSTATPSFAVQEMIRRGDPRDYAYKLLQEKKFDEAEDVSRGLLQKYNGMKLMYPLHVEILLRQEAYAEALRFLNETNYQPRWRESRIGYTLCAMGKWEEARKLLNDRELWSWHGIDVAKHPAPEPKSKEQTKALWAWLAGNSEQDGIWHVRVWYLLQAVEAFPNEFRIRKDLGQAYVAGQKYELAIAEYDRILASKPDRSFKWEVLNAKDFAVAKLKEKLEKGGGSS